MKDFVCALIILLAIIAGLVMYNSFIADSGEVMLKLTDNCIKSVETGENMQQCLDSLSSEWKKRSNTLLYMLNHSVIAPVDIMIAGFQPMLDSKRIDLYNIELQRLREALEQFTLMEALTLQNLF